MKNQLGQFYLPCELVETKQWQALGILKHCVIVRAEKLYMRDMYHYVAMSPRFQVLPEGCMAPEYKWEFHKGEFLARRIT